MQIGAQFYTLREQCKTLEDFAESLKRVADIGYRLVQISGVCAYEPEWLREQLRANGLRCVLTHIPPERLEKEPETVAAEHTVFGCDYIGLGCGSKEAGTKGMDQAIRLAANQRPLFCLGGQASFVSQPWLRIHAGCREREDPACLSGGAYHSGGAGVYAGYLLDPLGRRRCGGMD